jgi:hypothetical protein
MRSASWYRQRAVDCLEGAAKIFGDPDQANWLRTIADRWFRIASGTETSAAEHRLSPLRRPDQRGATHNEPRARALLGAGMNVYERRLPLDDIAGCPLGDLLAYWERRRGNGGSCLALPARRDLNFRSIKSLLGRINVVAVHREPPAMRFVWCLHGTESVLVHGVDRTGKDTSTLHPAYYRELVERHYRECATCGEPTLYEIESDFDRVRRPQYYRRLLLPLAADGRTVDMLLAAWDADLRSRIMLTDRLEQDAASGASPGMT